MGVPKLAKHYAQIASAAAGSIAAAAIDPTDDLTINSVTGDLVGDVTGDVTGNVTGDVTGNVTGDVTGDVTGNADTATLADEAVLAQGVVEEACAGITIEALTAGIAAPAGLADGAMYLIHDTADTDAIYLVAVYDGAFYLTAELTAAQAAG